MKQERLKVLSMLEDGKITAEEAAKLLESLKRGGPMYVWEDDYSGEFEDRVNRFSRNVENFGKDFKCRMESAYKDMEPKLQNATRSVLEKTAAIIDDISSSLNESLRNMSKDHKPCCDEEDCGCGCGEAETEAANDDKPIEN